MSSSAGYPPSVSMPSIHPAANPQPQMIIADAPHQILPAPPPRPARLGASFEYLEKIREELISADSRLEALDHLHNSYLKYYDLYHRTNAEYHRQMDINARYQAIISQLLPMLAPQVQEGVRQDMDSIKQLSQQILPVPPAPPATMGVDAFLSPVTRTIMPVAPTIVTSEAYESERKGRGRPPKSTIQTTKRLKADEGMEGAPPSSAEGPGSFSYPPDSYAKASNGLSRAKNAKALAPGAVPYSASLIASLNHTEVVCAMAMSNPFSYVFTGGKGGVKIWDVANVRDTRTAPYVGMLHCLDHYIRACKITPDGKTLIVGGEVNYMAVCDVGSTNPSVLGKIETPGVLTYALATSQDSRFCFSCCSDGTVNMWDIHNRKLVRTLGNHEESVTCCCVTPDGAKLVTGSLDKTVKMWDIMSGKELSSYEFPSQIFSLGYSPLSPPTIAVGPGTSRLLNDGHTDCVLSLKYAPTGNWFVTTGKDKKWVGWKAATGDKMFEIAEAASILCCEISSCGEYVATGSGDSVANLYQVSYV
ncbi:WD40-repeat-containing domain protein [Zopfochytrium polystomum]|nr:WD40-repeat-containing domain protein [Zopfochytrium polystomum]